MCLRGPCSGAPPPAQVEVLDPVPGDRDGALLRVVEALEQAHAAGLAAAYSRDPLPPRERNGAEIASEL